MSACHTIPIQTKGFEFLEAGMGIVWEVAGGHAKMDPMWKFAGPMALLRQAVRSVAQVGWNEDCDRPEWPEWQFLEISIVFFFHSRNFYENPEFHGNGIRKRFCFVAHFYCYYAQGLCSACRSTRRTGVWMCCDEGWFPAFPTGAPVEKMKGGLAPPQKYMEFFHPKMFEGISRLGIKDPIIILESLPIRRITALHGSNWIFVLINHWESSRKMFVSIELIFFWLKIYLENLKDFFTNIAKLYWFVATFML